mmetsp:Transcript_16186/g.44550  ORF Transcript_16186/g.44550 Transcript_16186/m.44550 type:complete len:229 (-) Transcript_16186:25-711(-)
MKALYTPWQSLLGSTFWLGQTFHVKNEQKTLSLVFLRPLLFAISLHDGLNKGMSPPSVEIILKVYGHIGMKPIKASWCRDELLIGNQKPPLSAREKIAAILAAAAMVRIVTHQDTLNQRSQVVAQFIQRLAVGLFLRMPVGTIFATNAVCRSKKVVKVEAAPSRVGWKFLSPGDVVLPLTTVNLSIVTTVPEWTNEAVVLYFSVPIRIAMASIARLPISIGGSWSLAV